MDEWATYSLIDFVPMEPEVYFRLFVRQNSAVWPLQIPASVLGVVLLWLAGRGNGRWFGPLLAMCWLFIGISFHLNLYAELNPAAPYAGGAFIVQALLLAGYGLGGWLSGKADGRMRLRQRAGLASGVLILVVYPLIGPLTGRSWQGIELFGIAPDPTVLMTLAIVPAGGRLCWPLAVIPLLWCVFSGATWYAMEWYPGLIVPALALLLILDAIRRQSRASGA